MRIIPLFAIAALCFSTLPASAAKAPKCPKGQTSVGDKCAPACPTEGVFRDPDACECPAGSGKILFGNGGGQCARLRCPAGAEIPADRDCDCPVNYQKRKLAKGKVRCEAQQAQAR